MKPRKSALGRDPSGPAWARGAGPPSAPRGAAPGGWAGAAREAGAVCAGGVGVPACWRVGSPLGTEGRLPRRLSGSGCGSAGRSPRSAGVPARGPCPRPPSRSGAEAGRALGRVSRAWPLAGSPSPAAPSPRLSHACFRRPAAAGARVPGSAGAALRSDFPQVRSLLPLCRFPLVPQMEAAGFPDKGEALRWARAEGEPAGSPGDAAGPFPPLTPGAPA